MKVDGGTVWKSAGIITMNPISGELYHKVVRNTPASRDLSPLRSTSKLVLTGNNLKSLLQPEGTIQYATEDDRFKTDFATEERARRQAIFDRRRFVQEHNRSLIEQRHFDRAISIEAIERQQHDRYRYRLSNYLEKQRSDFKSAFNPLTHEYDPTSKGKVLETHDRLAMMRAERRKEYVYAKGNSSYDLITGIARRPVY